MFIRIGIKLVYEMRKSRFPSQVMLNICFVSDFFIIANKQRSINWLRIYILAVQ